MRPLHGFGLFLCWSACVGPDDRRRSEGERAEVSAPKMVVDPLHIDFDVLRLGEEDLESIWVSNAGTGPLDLFEVVLDGAGAYSLVSVPPLPYSLDPGDWVELQVGYAAEEARDEGKVTVRGSDEASPEQVVGLVGALVVPALAIDPLAVTFGELPPLCEEHSTVTLRSVGSAPLTIESIGLEGEAYTLSDPPALPVTLDPDDAVVVEVTVLPLDEREYAGTLAVGSDDPAGVAVATFETTGKEGVSCDGYTKTDVSIVADHGRVDVALLIDTTASMGPAVAALASEFASIAGAVGLRLPDATFGVGTFDDYNQLPFGSGDDKPFVLRQQQTDDVGRVATVVGELALHNGEDAPASSHEALVQAVAGAGYDQNCDGRYNAADDVRPFISGSGDAYGGIVAGSHDAAVPGSGSAGGMGFREGALPILILATDGEMRDPEAGWASPGGCPSDASFYHVYTSIAEIGAKFIGVAAHGSATVRTQLANLAIVTDSYADLDGDLVTEPTVVEWSGSNPELRELVVNAVVSLVDGAWFGRVALEPQDPLGLIVYVRPRAHVGVAAGDPLDFEVKVRGTVVPEATAASEAVELRLLADDGVVVGNRTLFIEP